MNGRVCVYGLWHLGCVTAACLAERGMDVVGLDRDASRIAELALARPPVAEPGLPELLRAGLESGRLAFTSDISAALAGTQTVWVTFDTPVDGTDRADVDWVRQEVEHLRTKVEPGTLMIISSQVPVGFAAALRTSWLQDDPMLSFVSAPENLRLGQALEAFRSPARVVIGATSEVDRARVKALLGPVQERIVWMSLESAEMTKHALNAFLATSVAYTNEVARVCETVGADAAEVEQGLRSDPRIGPGAYISAGPALAGGTLMRDVRFLCELGERNAVATPVLVGVQASNQVHMDWTRARLAELLQALPQPHVAVLGLTYKVGTDTLRRSSALELAAWLNQAGVTITAYDPVVRELPAEISGVQLNATVEDALRGADVVVLATPWPEFASLDADLLVRTMRHPQVIDQSGRLAHLAADARIRYVRVGSSRPVAGE